jgi:hypothetical protein
MFFQSLLNQFIMKNLGFKFLFVASLIVVSSSSQAQFIKKLKQAASQGMENAVERKVQQEAEKMMTRQLEKQLAGLFGESGSSSPINFNMEELMAGLGQDVPTQDSYEFTGFLVLELQTKDEKGKSGDPMNMKSYLSNSTEYTGMEMMDPKEPETVTNMIFDTKNKASILLMESEGTKNSFAYKLDFDAIIEESIEESDSTMEDDDIEVKKSGNSKSILGYDCDEYSVKTNDGAGTYWITDKLIEGTNSFWSSSSPFSSNKMQEKYADHFANMPKGNFMEMNFKSTDGSDMQMKVIDIQPSAPQTFKMSDYPNMMQAMKQQ